jgi:NADPH2 dehydrogenase
MARHIHAEALVQADGPALFTPFALRGLTLPNRIVLSPMGQHTAVEGTADDWLLMHLGQFAASGVGCVITGAAAPSPEARITHGCLGIWNEAHLRAFARLRKFFDAHSNSALGVQLNHCGRKGSITDRHHGSHPILPEAGGWKVEGAGSIPFPGRLVPRPLSHARLDEIKADFANAARIAHDSGVDLLEIHAAHGYLLHSFLSPLSNNRDDAYGGSLANRMRFPLDVFQATRAAFPADKPVGVRVSATDWAEGGWTLEETLTFCRELKHLGCDYICASSGGTTPDQRITIKPLYQAPFAAAIRSEIDIPTIAVGLITEPEQAEGLLQDGTCDLVALGRGLVANPRWPWQAARRLSGKVFVPHHYAGMGPR